MIISSLENVTTPGKLLFGALWTKKIFGEKEANDTKKAVLDTVIQVGGEAGYDLEKKSVVCDVAWKLRLVQRQIAMKLKLNEQFQMCSSLAFVPRKSVKLIWSDKVNLSTFFSKPEYKYGFAFEFNLNSFP